MPEHTDASAVLDYMRNGKGILGPVLVLCTGALMIVLLAAGYRQGREQAAAARSYRASHALFEDIVLCGAGVPSGAVGPGRGEDVMSGLAADEADEPARAESGSDQASAAGTADAKTDVDQAENEEQTGLNKDPAFAVQEVVLHKHDEGKWRAYIPADLSDRVYIRFSHLQSLQLYGRGEEEPSFSLRDGDLLDCDALTVGEGSPEKGWTWRAVAESLDGTSEEAEIRFFVAEKVPTLYMTTMSGGLDAVNADKSVREDGRYVFYTEDGRRDVSGKCKIHGRGNSSWKEDKKQYSLNLASAREVLGMESAEKYALIANSTDDSNMRNKAALDLAALCGMPSTPESVFVNVYVNGNYNGLYLLAERPSARGGSVRLKDLETANAFAAEPADPDENSTAEPVAGTAGTDQVEGRTETDAGITVKDEDGLEIHAASDVKVPDNISGGYLLEMDGRYEDEPYWFSTSRHHFVVKYPEAIPLGEAQYIAEYVRAAERAFYQESGTNPVTGRSWEEYLDAESWSRMYLLQDFLVQWDVESFSFFVYKEADDPLLYCGPVWDFDLSAGTTGIGRLPNITKYSMWLRDHREGWLTKLAGQETFRTAVYRDAAPSFFSALQRYLEETEATEDEAVGDSDLRDIPGFCAQTKALRTSAAMDCSRWDRSNDFAESAEDLRGWLLDRSRFWQGYAEDPDAYCKVTFRYGFSDMDIYVRRGESIGFVPVEDYGEHLYGSFRRKYGEITGWTDERGEVLTEDTVITEDKVFVPSVQE